MKLKTRQQVRRGMVMQAVRAGAAAKTYTYTDLWTASGTIVDSLAAEMEGVLVTAALTSAPLVILRSALTGSDGTYTITGLPDETYDITPSFEGYTFANEDEEIEIDGADYEDIDFTGTAE